MKYDQLDELESVAIGNHRDTSGLESPHRNYGLMFKFATFELP